MATNLKRTIMRRVYYAYTISLVTSAALWQGFVLGACIALFGRLTHVAAISHNFSSVPLKSAPDFVINAFINAINGGEILTVLVALFMVGLSLKFFYQATVVLSMLRKANTI